MIYQQFSMFVEQYLYLVVCSYHYPYKYGNLIHRLDVSFLGSSIV